MNNNQAAPDVVGSPTPCRLPARRPLLAGIYEALELRDGGAPYMGKGVSKVRCSVVGVRTLPMLLPAAM